MEKIKRYRVKEIKEAYPDIVQEAIKQNFKGNLPHINIDAMKYSIRYSCTRDKEGFFNIQLRITDEEFRLTDCKEGNDPLYDIILFIIKEDGFSLSAI